MTKKEVLDTYKSIWEGLEFKPTGRGLMLWKSGRAHYGIGWIYVAMVVISLVSAFLTEPEEEEVKKEKKPGETQAHAKDRLKLKRFTKAVSILKRGKSKCGKSTDAEKCKAKINDKISKIESKISKIKTRLKG